MALNTNTLSQAANEARGLAMDAIAACSSGHLGLPLGSADIGAVLFGYGLTFDAKNPRWLGRDRFVLSAGHGSMFIYSWLHLAGFDVSLEDLAAFRKLHSKTPGHPEFGETPGVECTTGPLGQGVGNSVGLAISGKMAAAKYNTPEHEIFGHHVVALAGDGCLQEGVAMEASSLAAHLQLDNLIIFYDSNDVTLDAMAEKSQSEDTCARYAAMGFDVVTIDGHDMHAVQKALDEAKANKNGKPKFIECKTLIGKGIPEVAGTAAAHGEGGAKFVKEARAALGLPEGSFYVSEETRTYFEGHQLVLAEKIKAWNATFEAWEAANPELASELEQSGAELNPADLLAAIPAAEVGKAQATRGSGGTILNAIAKAVPNVVSGSADLHGSTKNYIKEGGDFLPGTYHGRNFLFGIREHGMGAILNGLAYDGLFRPSGATFLTFADYLRPAIRLAALCKLPVQYIFTHDSIGVGEDGPTHQPVETVSGLRCIPNLDVIRPADAEEAAGAFAAAYSRIDGPTVLSLSRQNLPDLESIPATTRREGALKGGYIARKEAGDTPSLILLATGSELHLALGAAQELGEDVRVVSLPCFERFERQSADYKESVLPASVTKRISIEAGVTATWGKYVGLAGTSIGTDTFGLSAPAPEIYNELGVTQAALVAAGKKLLG